MQPHDKSSRSYVRLRRPSEPRWMVAGVVVTTLVCRRAAAGCRALGRYVDGQPAASCGADPDQRANAEADVHTSIGGERVRVRFSNAYGTSDSGHRLGARRAQRRRFGDCRRTDRTLRFNGSPTITIPAGALVVSDAVTLDVPALGDIAVSLYLPGV